MCATENNKRPSRAFLVIFVCDARSIHLAYTSFRVPDGAHLPPSFLYHAGARPCKRLKNKKRVDVIPCQSLFPLPNTCRYICCTHTAVALVSFESVLQTNMTAKITAPARYLLVFISRSHRSIINTRNPSAGTDETSKACGFVCI